MATDPFERKAKDRENKVEKRICEIAAYYGWMNFKITSPAFDGMPDRGFVKFGETFTVVECKQLGKKPTKLQKVRAKQLAEQGVRVFWLDNEEGAYEIFRPE